MESKTLFTDLLIFYTFQNSKTTCHLTGTSKIFLLTLIFVKKVYARGKYTVLFWRVLRIVFIALKIFFGIFEKAYDYYEHYNT